MNDGFRKRSWANVGGFVKERLKRAPTDFEHTHVGCLYAHYKKWAFFRGEAPVSEPVFCHRLEAATKLVPYDFRGYRMYEAMIVDVEPAKQKDEDADDSAKEPVEKGKVRARRDFDFLDERVKAGQIMSWMEPTDYERERLKSLSSERDSRGQLTWLIVEFLGKRRYVCSADVEKVH